jgi:hypothetical protein
MKRSYNVRPRYGCGSPALVFQHTAEQVAASEQRCYQDALDGIYGERLQERAKRLGLRGISEHVKETRKGWEVTDLCTGESYLRPFDKRMRKDGWVKWEDLEPHLQELVATVEPVVSAEAVRDTRMHWFRVPALHEFWSKDGGYDAPSTPPDLIWEPRLEVRP